MENSANTVLSVGQVCSYVKQVFDSEEMLHGIVVSGEVSNLKTVGGYVYFNLKDNDGVLSCVCFGLLKNDLPNDGDHVYVSGSISFYPKGGRVSFIVSSITKAGLGSWMVLYKQLVDKLSGEGLFDADRKKAIPTFPKKVCVVTSKTGAVIRDIVTTIRAKNDDIDIAVVDVRVQGVGAVDDIINGLKLADESGADVVILARGGGSWEDLLPFCDERMARAVFDMHTPIISAVGHETDTTLVDFVSDLRVATPTAAGEAVTYSISEQRKVIQGFLARIRRDVENKIEIREHELLSLSKIISTKAERCFDKAYSRLGLLTYKTKISAENKLIQRENSLRRVLNRISTNNPLSILQKGLFKVSVDGETVSSMSQIKKGDLLRLDSIEFEIDAEVKDVRSRREER